MTIQERLAQAIKQSMEKKGVSTETVNEIKVLEGQYVSAKGKSGK